MVSGLCAGGCLARILQTYSLRPADSQVRAPEFNDQQMETDMLSWIFTFLILAIIAAVLGFSGIAGAAASVAKLLFFVFLALLIISALANALRGRPPI